MRFVYQLCAGLCAIACFGWAAESGKKLSFAQESDQLHILLGDVTLATYLTKSDVIKRPGFINLRTAKGTVVTRPFPVREDVKNGGDHPDMHPGLWLGFGDLNGVDFWRNKGRVEQVKFTQTPVVEKGAACFTALNRYLAPDGHEVCQQTMKAVIGLHPHGWRMALETELWTDGGDLTLGMQEEMGLGVRMANTLNEKFGGGLVVNSLGDRGAKAAWGKEAAWWDYSGPQGQVGIMALASPDNPLKCWGHTRDYGLMVVNPTPTAAAEHPRLTVAPKGSHLLLNFEVLIHETDGAFVPQTAAAEMLKWRLDCLTR